MPNFIFSIFKFEPDFLFIALRKVIVNKALIFIFLFYFLWAKKAGVATGTAKTLQSPRFWKFSTHYRDEDNF